MYWSDASISQILLAKSETRKSKAGLSLPGAVRKSMALLTLGFWTSILQNCETIKLDCFKPPSFGSFVKAALGNQQNRLKAAPLASTSSTKLCLSSIPQAELRITIASSLTHTLCSTHQQALSASTLKYGHQPAAPHLTSSTAKSSAQAIIISRLQELPDQTPLCLQPLQSWSPDSNPSNHIKI